MRGLCGPAERNQNARMIARTLLPLLLVASVRAGEVPERLRKEFKLAPFYTQSLMVGDFPIVASAKVNPAALEEAKVIVGSMLSQRKDIVAALAKAHIRLTVMATSERTCDVPEHSDLKPAAFWNRRARGLGATMERPSVSCAEENVLCLKSDPYSTENILVHEFAHAIEGVGLKATNPEFAGKLQKAYDDAIAAGKWKGKYAGSNVYEYWGEAVQSWFGTNRENDNEHNYVNTRAELIEYDPEVAKLCAEVFGKNDWQYVRADDPARKNEPHLKNLDRSTLPVFEWSEEERKPMPEPKDQ